MKAFKFLIFLAVGLSLAFAEAKVKTLVLVSHPYYESSTYIKALESAAKSVKGVEVRNLDKIYGSNTKSIDAAKERELMRGVGRVVFLFPTHWFNITPMMKAYLNEAWGSVGYGLWQGKQMLIVSTAAGGTSTYGKNGHIGMRLKDVFTPMKATALHCGMEYLEPLVFEGIRSDKIPSYQKAFIERLRN